MKKLILALCSLLCLVLVLNLAACGGEEESSAAPSPSPSPAASATPKPSASPKPTGTPKPSATPKPTATPTPQPTEAPTPEPVYSDTEDEPDYDPNEGGDVFVQPSGGDDEDNEPDNNGGGDTPNVPYDLIGSDVSALYGAYGYPNSSEYGPSCIGPGQDGVLYYSGFTVYTYSENGVETIQDVA